MHAISNHPDFILLNIGYSELNANWNWKKVCSPFSRIYYVTEGEAKVYMNGQAYILQPEHLYLTPPFTLHDDFCDSHFSLYYIHFYEEAIRKESLFDKYHFPVSIEASDLDRLLTERLLSINPGRVLRDFDPQRYDNPPVFSQYMADNNRMPLHSVVESKGILYQLMARFLQKAEKKAGDKDARVSRCLQYIHEHIGEDISVPQLAEIACMTEDHLIRIFRKEINHTPIRYINLKKVERAQLLLLVTRLPVKEIAMELSIDNISYFNRLFKQHTGITPGRYREVYGDGVQQTNS